MKTTINVHIVAKGKPGPRVMRKVVDLPFAPSVGMEVHDDVWHDPRKIIRVVLNISEMHLSVVLKDEIDGSADIDQHVKMYESHDWKQPAVGDY